MKKRKGFSKQGQGEKEREALRKPLPTREVQKGGGEGGRREMRKRIQEIQGR